MNPYDQAELRMLVLNVDPAQLAEFLRIRGWSDDGTGPRSLQMKYTAEGSPFTGATILLPLSREFADFGARLHEVIEIAAQVLGVSSRMLIQRIEEQTLNHH